MSVALRASSMALLGLLAVGAGPLAGQLSPGDLSAPHAALEGSGRCLECHEPKKGVSADRCLSCHELLRARIEAGEGLHSHPEYDRCESCHIEHHGREFELVWWGDEGPEAFDHGLTGYPLEGAHGRLGCRDCHKPDLVSDPVSIRAADKDPARTFLGLERETCLSCHADEHHGQFAAGSCFDCHDDRQWRPASGFEHAGTRFPLTGEHVRVACDRCHPMASTVAEPDRGFVRYSNIEHASCTECHRDEHQGRLGGDCESCHDTRGWRRLDRGRFDHDRTRFALEGAHASVSCEGCHPPGGSMRVARFGACTDCHRDIHLGQLSPSASTNGCETCHTVERFVPSTVTLASHQQTDFPLEGGHLATPCDGCHQRVAASAIPGVSPRSATDAAGVIQFRFTSALCRDCHDDPHAGSAASVSEERGCPTCHSVASWRAVDFDHDATRFSLDGAHAAVGCRDCHDGPESAGEPGFTMGGAPTACVGCHVDLHRGQFDESGAAADCGRCHSTRAWRPVSFVHDRDSRFALTGAHARVDCGRCHLGEGEGETAFVRYKPLPTACSDCHGDSIDD